MKILSKKTKVEDYVNNVTRLEICGDLIELMNDEPLGITIGAVSRYYDCSESLVRSMLNDLVDGKVLNKVFMTNESYYWPRELRKYYPNERKVDFLELETLAAVNCAIEENNGKPVNIGLVFTNSIDLTRAKTISKLNKIKDKGLISLRKGPRNKKGEIENKEDKDGVYSLTKTGNRYLEYLEYYPRISDRLGLHYEGMDDEF